MLFRSVTFRVKSDSFISKSAYLICNAELEPNSGNIFELKFSKAFVAESESEERINKRN